MIINLLCLQRWNQYPDDGQNLAMRTIALLMVWIKMHGHSGEGGIDDMLGGGRMGVCWSLYWDVADEWEWVVMLSTHDRQKVAWVHSVCLEGWEVSCLVLWGEDVC